MLSYRPSLANGLFISPSMKRAIVPLHWAQHATTGRTSRTNQTRYTTSNRPVSSTCLPKINRDSSILQWSLRANGQTQSTGRAAQTIGRADRTAPAHMMHRPDALHATTGCDSASVRSWSRELPSRPDAFDQLFAMLYSSGCPTGRFGSVRDQTRQLQTLTPVRLTAALN
jgi:hypothetical protein